MENNTKPHSILQTLGLHLIPGALMTAFFFITAPAIIRLGYPSLMSLLLAILLILIPFELGLLLYQGKKLNGRFSLKGVVLFCEPIPVWQIILLVVGLVLWSGLMFTLLPKVDRYFIQSWFAWFPSWSLPANTMGNPDQYSGFALKLTVLVCLALNGIAGPIVEELYFRGYLLPRIPSSRWIAPLINVLLFSLYHFFSPWQNITRILALLPLVYVVAWKRNIHIGIWAHCILNIIGMASLFALLFR